MSERFEINTKLWLETRSFTDDRFELVAFGIYVDEYRVTCDRGHEPTEAQDQLIRKALKAFEKDRLNAVMNAADLDERDEKAHFERIVESFEKEN